MSNLIPKYGHQLRKNEIEVIDSVLKFGRGLAVAKKKDLENYPNLLNNQLVYVDTWGGSMSLKATLKGEGFFNELNQNPAGATAKYYITVEYNSSAHLMLLTNSGLPVVGRKDTLSFVFDFLTNQQSDLIISLFKNDAPVKVDYIGPQQGRTSQTRLF